MRRANDVVRADVVPCELSETDRAAIQGMRETDVENVRLGNWEAVASLFADDILLMPPNAPDVQGKTSLRAYMATYPPLPDYSISYDEIGGCGGLAYVKGSYRFSLSLDGDPVTETGRFLYILRKQPDGGWLISRDMNNSDRPLPSGS